MKTIALLAMGVHSQVVTESLNAPPLEKDAVALKGKNNPVLWDESFDFDSTLVLPSV